MNRISSYCLAAGVAALLFTGCATPTRVVDSDGPRTILSTDKINQQDWNAAAVDLIKKMQDEFINSGKLQSLDGPGKPCVMAISRFLDDTELTAPHIDMDMLIKRIRIALRQTGKVYTDVTGGLGGVEDPLADEWKRKRLFETGGKVRPPDYTLSGKIGEDKTRAGRIREVTYFFQLNLASPDGLAVWEGEKRITKQGSKASIGL